MNKQNKNPFIPRLIRPAQHKLCTHRFDNTPDKKYGENNSEYHTDDQVFSFHLFDLMAAFQRLVLDICQIDSNLPDHLELSDFFESFPITTLSPWGF